MKTLKNKKKYYLHTINGHPGYYVENEQICYTGGKVIFPDHFVRSLEQIRKEQKLTIAWRAKQGWDIDHKYNYILFYIGGVV